MNSSIAWRYPRFDSRERRLSRTADLLWSRSGRPSLVFGRFGFAGLLLVFLLISTASTAVPMSLPCSRTRSPFYGQVDWICKHSPTFHYLSSTSLAPAAIYIFGNWLRTLRFGCK